MDIYLVRHAVAHKRDFESWPNDAERPLTPEGERNFRPAAHGLEVLAPEIEVLLSSPYARAWRTAEILDEETSWPAPGVFPALEPDIMPHKVAAALATYSQAETIALVGHRPSLHELAAYLLCERADALNIGLKKGGAACIRFQDAPEPGSGKLRWLLTPQILRAVGCA
ncbi:MAG: histidine phosphatase family protein [Rubrobacteraceae bacterium]